MSITITTDVFCDECNDWVHGTTGPRSATREARSVARANGWKCDRDGDLCPTCQGQPHAIDRPSSIHLTGIPDTTTNDA